MPISMIKFTYDDDQIVFGLFILRDWFKNRKRVDPLNWIHLVKIKQKKLLNSHFQKSYTNQESMKQNKQQKNTEK